MPGSEDWIDDHSHSAFRTGAPWRDLPAEFGPWPTVWKRHFRYAADGTYDTIMTTVVKAGLVADDTTDLVEKFVAIGSTTVRAHQHAAGARKDSVGAQATPHTGRAFELQGSTRRAC